MKAFCVARRGIAPDDDLTLETGLEGAYNGFDGLSTKPQ